MKVAALFVEENGPYSELPEVELWHVGKDARTYEGPWPVVAHPPCERWGRYWSGGPSAKERRILGDDDGCFFSALNLVRRYGGVLEHPEASHAFRFHDLRRPPRGGGWIEAGDGWGWTCCVEQGHYGHPARKATWLYTRSETKPEDLIWGPSAGQKMDEGFHSAEERKEKRATGQKPIKRLTAKENLFTPVRFRDLLLDIACRG